MQAAELDKQILRLKEVFNKQVRGGQTAAACH